MFSKRRRENNTNLAQTVKKSGVEAADFDFIGELDRQYVEEKLILGMADNIHDFWGGYRNRPGGEEINRLLVNIFGNTLLQSMVPNDARIQRIKTIDTSRSPSDIMTELFRIFSYADNKSPISISNIEDSTIDYLRKKLSYIAQPSPDAQASYDTILDPSYDVVSKAKDLRLSYDTYSLSATSTRVKHMNDPNKQKIRDFILTFLFGESSGYMTYFTFDAAPKVIGKLFRNYSDARGLIIPQNIADSATTSFEKLGKEPNLFVFPETAPGMFVCASNFLTRTSYGMRYINNGFSEKTPYGFEYQIADTTENVSASKYGGSYRQGPSLDYLMELTLLASKSQTADFSAVWPASGCLKIGDDIQKVGGLRKTIVDNIRNNRNTVFAEIKRGGDEDVSYAVKALQNTVGKHIVVVTIDRLCAMMACMLGLPCILHNGDNMTLFKNKLAEKSLTPEAIASFMAEKTRKFVMEYAGLFNTLKAGVSILTSFTESIPHTLEDGPNIIMNGLLSRKLADMYDYMMVVVGILGSDDIRNLNLIEEYVSEENREANRDTLEQFLAIFRERGIDISVLIKIQNIIVQNKVFNKSIDYDFLKYDSDQFTELYSAYVSIKSKIESTRPMREPLDLLELLNGPDGYNTLLTQILDSFNNENELRGQFIIPNSYEGYNGDVEADRAEIAAYFRDAELYADIVSVSERNARRDAFNAQKQSAINAAVRIRTFLAQRVNLSLNGSGNQDANIQEGGAYTSDQIAQEASDIIRGICSTAAAYINDRFAKTYPEIKRIFDINNVARNQVLYNARQNTVDGPVYLAQLNESLARYNAVWQRQVTIDGVQSETVPSNNISLRDFYSRVSLAEASQLLESLSLQWSTEFQNNSDLYNNQVQQLPCINAIQLLLNPYDDTGNLKVGNREVFTPNVYDVSGADLLENIPIYNLVVLTTINDIFEGNVGTNTSLIQYVSGPISTKVNVSCNDLPRMISAISRMIYYGRYRAQVWNLFGGRRRRTIRRRRHRNRRRSRRM